MNAVAVGHDHEAVAFDAMRDQVAAEAPVATAVAEVPALAPLLDLKPTANGPTPTGVTISWMWPAKALAR